MEYDRPDGSPAMWEGRATIANGRWRFSGGLPDEARSGGYLTLQFTGYRVARVRGEQDAKQVAGS